MTSADVQVVRDRSAKPVQAIIAWVAAILTVGYMLPWAIAATRGKSNSGAIGLINLLLGWSVIGWIVALVMACSAHKVAAVRS
jgi:T4 superinfection immunity protein